MVGNEWDFHDAMKKKWAKTGLVIDATRLFLVGDEVMSDWRRNDSDKNWDLPSADFLFAGADGTLWAMELKLKKTRTAPRAHAPLAQRDALELLCQITMQSARLQKTCDEPNLRKFYALAERHGDPFVEHQRFFGLPRPIEQFAPDGAIHRMVAAPALGPSVHEYLTLFQGRPVEDVWAKITESQYVEKGHFARLKADFLSTPTYWADGARTQLRAVVLSEDGRGTFEFDSAH